MKKSLLVALLATLSLSTVAVAEGDNTVGISYALRDTIASDKDNPNRQGINLSFAHKFNSNWAVDANEQFRTERLNSNEGKSTTRLETGVTYTLPITKDISAYTRGGLGYKFTSTDDFTYYAIEPGIKYQATDALNLRVAYRFRDAFSSGINDKTNTVRIGGEYNLTKEHVVTFGIDRFYGDSEAIGYNLGYGYKF